MFHINDTLAVITFKSQVFGDSKCVKTHEMYQVEESVFVFAGLQGKEATVEPWEDTNFDLYKGVDRFGFVQ